MEKKDFIVKNYKKLLITLGTVLAVYIGMKYLLPLFVPFLFAYFFAWVLRPVVSFLHRRLKIPLFAGGIIGVVLLLSVTSFLLIYLIRIICNQFVLFLRNIPIYERILSQQLEGICTHCDKFFGLKSGSIRMIVDDGMTSFVNYVQCNILPKVTQQTIRIAFLIIGFTAITLFILVATVLIIKDMEDDKAGIKKSEFYPVVHKITAKLSDTGIAYMKTQVIIMSIIAGVNSVGFFILKNPYALLIGLFVGVFDALPVLGSGLVLIPWCIVMLIQKKFFDAAIIMTVFVLCQVIREILEPRLLGNRIGIKPIYNMMAMYVGFQLFGVIGFFLGPLSLVIIRAILFELIPTEKKDDSAESTDRS